MTDVSTTYLSGSHLQSHVDCGSSVDGIYVQMYLGKCYLLHNLHIMQKSYTLAKQEDD